MENKDILKWINTRASVVNHFNQDSAAEIIAIKKFMKEEDLETMLIREDGHREVR